MRQGSGTELLKRALVCVQCVASPAALTGDKASEMKSVSQHVVFCLSISQSIHAVIPMLFICRVGAYQEKRSWESCICPRTWGLPSVGRVLISKGGVSMRFRRRPQNVPVVSHPECRLCPELDS